jgi:twinkle protein
MRAIPLHAIPVVKSTDVDFRAWIQPEERQRLITPADLRGELFDHMHRQASGEGLALPWEKAGNRVRFQRGKLSVWTGITHHGKTLLLKLLMQHAMRCGEKVCIASFEERPLLTVGDMLQQAAHTATPSQAFIDAWCDWASTRLVIYDQQKMVAPEIIVGVANYVAREMGVTHFVVDSLMRLGLDGDDYNGQRRFFNLIGAAASASNIHVHVVAHGRKGGEDEKPLSIFDIKGSGDVINQADLILQVWRNKTKDTQDRMTPDGRLIVHKQRGNPNWLGAFDLWHDARSNQHIGGPDHSPLCLFSMNDDGLPQSVAW